MQHYAYLILNPKQDKNVSISIFDVGGQQLFREVRQEFYPETEAVLLVFDAREEKPLVGLQRWIDEFTEEGGSIERALVIIGQLSKVLRNVPVT